jgi:L-fuconolactonase
MGTQFQRVEPRNETLMILDGHVHLFRPVSDGYPRATSELFPAERAALSAELLDLMTAEGVDRAVVVSLSEHDEYVRDCVIEHPGRFSGILVDRGPGRESLAEFDERCRWAGTRGLRMNYVGDPREGDPRRLSRFALLRYLAEHGMKLWFYGPPEQLGLLDGVASELGSLEIVLNHLGFCPDRIEFRDGLAHSDVDLPPPTLEVVTRLARHPNVYVMVSGEYCFSKRPYPFSDVAPIVRRLYEAFGPARLMWASDYPWIAEWPGYRRLLELPALHLPDVPDGDIGMIMGGTAAALFGFDHDHPAPCCPGK